MPCGRRRRRDSTTTSAAAAAAPTPTATTGRTQLRGSRSASSSPSESSSAQLDSSAAAWAVIVESVPYSRVATSSGGSIGRRASARSASRLSSPACSVIGHQLLELLDRAIDQHLGGPVGAAQRPCDLPVRHAEREAHDQSLAAVVGKIVELAQNLPQLLA